MLYHGLVYMCPILDLEIVANLDLGVIFKVKVKNKNEKMKKN